MSVDHAVLVAVSALKPRSLRRGFSAEARSRSERTTLHSTTVFKFLDGRAIRLTRHSLRRRAAAGTARRSRCLSRVYVKPRLIAARRSATCRSRCAKSLTATPVWIDHSHIYSEAKFSWLTWDLRVASSRCSGAGERRSSSKGGPVDDVTGAAQVGNIDCSMEKKWQNRAE